MTLVCFVLAPYSVSISIHRVFVNNPVRQYFDPLFLHTYFYSSLPHSWFPQLIIPSFNVSSNTPSTVFSRVNRSSSNHRGMTVQSSTEGLTAECLFLFYFVLLAPTIARLPVSAQLLSSLSPHPSSLILPI